ncbi:MAG: GNAT family N-acetyltransferase [Anaerolineae bacterium]|nr:GNAT family N-acetyltransferase [Anaerolineae bacterium]
MYVVPENLRLRPARMEDAGAVFELKCQNAILLTGQTDESMEDMLKDWEDPEVSLESDLRVVENLQGEIIGFAEFFPQKPPVTMWLDIYVRRDYESSGISEVMAEWIEGRAHETIDQAPAGARVALRAYTYQEDERYYQPLLERIGLQRIRHSYRMKIDLDTPPRVPVIPAGFTIRNAISNQDERNVRMAVRESFKDHFGHVERDFDEDFQQWMHYWQDYDPSLWWLAFSGDELAGICLCEPKFADDDSMGWVGTLGVKREYRKHGLGRALLLTAFHEMYQRGKKGVGLGVDASSLTGAVALYEQAGMYVAQRFDLYEKELRAGVDMTTHELETAG